jgi:glutathionyl-hydroquinone reductase
MNGGGTKDMGVLIDGVWRDQELPQEVGRAGDFRRADSIFRDRITPDGSSGFKAGDCGTVYGFD